MLLAVDIGNSNIVMGLFDNGELAAHWRIDTLKDGTADDYAEMLAGLTGRGEARLEKGVVNDAIISSVAPEADEALSGALSACLGVKVLFAGEDVDYGIPVLTDDPREVGSDRIVNAVAAFERFKCALIVVDYGTATTFDYVTQAGEYAGGVIAPGIVISAEALHQKASKLPRIRIERPARVIGKNTVEAMQSGLFWGFVALTDGIIEMMIAESGGRPRVIATGGLAPLVKGSSRFVKEHDEFLTLKGLRIIHEGKR